MSNFAAFFPGHDLGKVLDGVAVGCIGPVMAATAREHGLTIAVEPGEYPVPAFARDHRLSMPARDARRRSTLRESLTFLGWQEYIKQGQGIYGNTYLH